MAKFYLNINDPLPVLPRNKQDLVHENIVNTYLFYQVYKVHDIRVFPKVDHSANIARIVLVEYTIGSVVELHFWQRFAKDLAKI